jgi:hypothetical protein
MGRGVTQQEELDNLMIDLDGTPNKVSDTQLMYAPSLTLHILADRSVEIYRCPLDYMAVYSFVNTGRDVKQQES